MIYSGTSNYSESSEIETLYNKSLDKGHHCLRSPKITFPIVLIPLKEDDLSTKDKTADVPLFRGSTDILHTYYYDIVHDIIRLDHDLL